MEQEKEFPWDYDKDAYEFVNDKLITWMGPLFLNSLSEGQQHSIYRMIELYGDYRKKRILSQTTPLITEMLEALRKGYYIPGSEKGEMIQQAISKAEQYLKQQ